MSDTRAGPSRRRDARRNRDAALTAAGRLLGAQRRLSMRAVAEAAGVGRATLYRNFANLEELQRALRDEVLACARAAIARALGESKAPLARLRSVVAGLVDVGARLPVEPPIGPPAERALAATGRDLRPLAGRLAAAAGLEPGLPAEASDAAIAQFVDACLRAGWSGHADPAVTTERVLRAITDPLDRGLLLVTGQGTVVALNDEARARWGPTRRRPASRRSRAPAASTRTARRRRLSGIR